MLCDWEILERILSILLLILVRVPLEKKHGYQRMFWIRDVDQKNNDKTLSCYKLTNVQKAMAFIKRVTHRFSGSYEAMMPDKVSMENVNSTEALKTWHTFNDPSKVYVLIFRNANGNNVQHASMVIGSTEGHSIYSSDIYPSWTLDEDPGFSYFSAERYVSNFEEEFLYHGKPEVIELPGLDVDKVKMRWNQIQKKRKRYRLLGFNCSTLVSGLIRMGLPRGKLRKMVATYSPLGFWTPYDVRSLAEEIKPVLELKEDSKRP